MPFKIKKAIIILFLIVLLKPLSAQSDKYVDSLITVLSKDSPDSIFKKSTPAIHSLASKFEIEDFKPKFIRAFSKLYEAGYNNNNHQQCGRSHFVLGILYDAILKHDSSLHYYFSASREFEKKGDYTSIANCYYRIARIHYYKGNLNDAIRYVNILINHYKRGNSTNQENLITPYMFKAVLLQAFPDSSKLAGDFYLRAIKIAEELQSGYLGVLYNNYGEYIEESSNDLKAALEYFEKAISIDKLKGDGSTSAYAYYCISKVLFKQKKYNDAIKELDRAKAYWIETNRFNDLINGYDLYCRIYENKGDYKNSIFYLRKKVNLNDSLIKLSNSQNMAELDTKYQVEKKDKELLKLKEKAAIEQLEKEKQENKSMMLMIGIGVSLLLGGFALYAYLNKQKANKLLDKEKHLVEQQKEILEVKNKEILDSITYAKRIQNAILPADNLFKQSFKEYFIFYKPKDIVAGDFYWLYKKEDSIYLAVCDCTGHGVPGALVSVVCNNSLERAVNEFKLKKPSAILDKTRELVKIAFQGNEENVNDGMDICLIHLHPSKNNSTIEIEYAGANNALWYYSENTMKELSPDKQPIGNYANEKPFTNKEIVLNTNDILYLFSDGYADQFGGPKGKKFKYKQLNEVILANHGKPLSDQKEILKHTFDNWKGDLEQVDDVCVIGIRL